MKRFIIALMICFASSTHAHIAQISSIHEIRPHTTVEHVLVAFDIDDTLTILDDAAFQRPNFKLHHAAIFKEIMSSLTPVEQTVAFTLPLLTTSSSLIEQDSPAFIADLQACGIKVIALTAAMGGEIAGVSIEDRRLSELRRVGIDFSYSFPDISERVFTGFSSPTYGREPLYKDGVILCNENDKGEVLVQFLHSLTCKPDVILFVDDRTEHLDAVKKAIESAYPDIVYKGFHFKSERVPYVPSDGTHFSSKWQEVADQAKAMRFTIP